MAPKIYENIRSLEGCEWQLYAKKMRSKFSDSEYVDPMLDLVSLKQVNIVEEYYEEFKSLLNLLQLPDDYALSVFISNLKPDLSKSVKLFYPKTLNHALSLAKQMESLVYNFPRKPFTPYKNTFTTITTPYQPSNTTKPHYTLGHNTHTGLLPTLRLPALPYHTQPKPPAQCFYSNNNLASIEVVFFNHVVLSPVK